MGNQDATMKLFISLLVLGCLGVPALNDTEDSLVKDKIQSQNQISDLNEIDRKESMKDQNVVINYSNHNRKQIDMRNEENNATNKEKREISRKERGPKRTKKLDGNRKNKQQKRKKSLSKRSKKTKRTRKQARSSQVKRKTR